MSGLDKITKEYVETDLFLTELIKFATHTNGRLRSEFLTDIVSEGDVKYAQGVKQGLRIAMDILKEEG